MIVRLLVLVLAWIALASAPDAQGKGGPRANDEDDRPRPTGGRAPQKTPKKPPQKTPEKPKTATRSAAAARVLSRQRRDASKRIVRLERLARTRWSRLERDCRQVELSARVLVTGRSNRRRSAPRTPAARGALAKRPVAATQRGKPRSTGGTQRRGAQSPTDGNTATAPAGIAPALAAVSKARAETKNAYRSFRSVTKSSSRTLRRADAKSVSIQVARAEHAYRVFASRASTLQSRCRTVATDLARIGQARKARIAAERHAATVKRAAEERARRAKREEAIEAQKRRTLASRIAAEEARLRRVDAELAALRKRLADLRRRLAEVRAAESKMRKR